MATTQGQLILSVDLSEQESPRQRHVLTSLLDLFSQHRLPGCWAMADPAASRQRSRLILGRRQQEIALLGDATWVGSSAGRTCFAHELLRRTQAAMMHGIPVHSLALREATLDRDLDLLVRNKISAVRAGLEPGGRPRPQSLRYGVWRSPVTALVPGRHGLWGGLLALRRLLRTSRLQRRAIHLVIDSQRVADDQRQLKLVRSLLRFAVGQQALGMEICGLQQAAQHALQTPHRRSQSILRVA